MEALEGELEQVVVNLVDTGNDLFFAKEQSLHLAWRGNRTHADGDIFSFKP